MRKLILIVVSSIIIISCNKDTRNITYFEESGQIESDTLPFDHFRGFPKLEKTTNADSLVAEIALFGKVHEEFIGGVGFHSEQYARFERLMELLSERQFFDLVEHENPVIRVYGFKGLKFKKSKYLNAAFTKLEHDTTTVRFFAGCLGGTFPVSRYITFID